jgi:hypothetical protein
VDGFSGFVQFFNCFYSLIFESNFNNYANSLKEQDTAVERWLYSFCLPPLLFRKDTAELILTADGRHIFRHLSIQLPTADWPIKVTKSRENK